MFRFLQALVDYLKAFFEDAPLEEYEIIPSVGAQDFGGKLPPKTLLWNAIYRDGNDDFTRRPLVHWQITWTKGLRQNIQGFETLDCSQVDDEVIAQHGDVSNPAFQKAGCLDHVFVFVDNRPPFLEMAYGHPNFVGYEREPVTASKDIKAFGNYEEFSEWS